MSNEKSFEEHLEYLHEIVRLKLWFLWQWTRKHPEESVASVLRERVDIYRKTDINLSGINPRENELRFESPRWLELENRTEQLLKQFRDDAATFESAAFKLFKPAIDARAQRDYEDDLSRKYLAAYQCGSLRYDEPKTVETPVVISFHIANAVRPNSIFSDSEYLPSCLFQLMDETEEKFGASMLNTNTWLNSVSRWLELFSQEWQDNLQPKDGNHDVQWHFGFWGQFINARGGFNRKLGMRFRSTGTIPYPMKHSNCSFAALRDHLTRRKKNLR